MPALINDFPPLHTANKEGLLAIGGVLTPHSVMDAYRKGIFPWYNSGEPVQWWSPNPRFVLFAHKIHISKKMKGLLAKRHFEFSINRSFDEVIAQCTSISRRGQTGTWITEEMVSVYSQLHQEGHAFSAECRLGNQLVGGMYGIMLDRVFCGESMFSTVDNASKYALIQFAEFLKQKGISFIDCQVYTPHLESMGAQMIPRTKYLTYLE